MYTFIFRYILVVILCNVCHCLDQCEKKNDCECMFSSGVRINLINFSHETFKANATENETIIFHPCRNESVGNTANPINCSVCLRNNTGHFENLGTTNEVTFKTVEVNNVSHLYMLFTHSNVTTSIELLCMLDGSSSFHSITGTYQHNLQLAWACIAVPPQPPPTLPLITTVAPTVKPHPSSGLSTGSILVIILFTFSSLYFAGGALALKLLRGAEGREMVPNLDFWVDLPYLVRDGALFVVLGFQPSPVYESI